MAYNCLKPIYCQTYSGSIKNLLCTTTERKQLECTKNNVIYDSGTKINQYYSYIFKDNVFDGHFHDD